MTDIDGGFWVLYRIVRGWLDLASGKPLPT